MDTEKLTPIAKAQKCIDMKQSFVLQGGAGSGKTESLKGLLLYMSKYHPFAHVICITHTNVAVDEIHERIGDNYPVCTIHSFFYSIIKNYKRNIKSVIDGLFVLPLMVKGERSSDISEVEYKKTEHKQYKDIHYKYANKLFALKRLSCAKAAGKREYDKDPDRYNDTLNADIKELNNYIRGIITTWDTSKINYNQTKFDSFSDCTYGHDGLLSIAHMLFYKYPLLKKIIADQYDYIFIDEYQDTRSAVIEDFISIVKDMGICVCLFGDTMQSIYPDGIGNVSPFLLDDTLIEIPKPDNYRCSYEVLNIINNLRLDSIKQKVALAVNDNGIVEDETQRHGIAKIQYAIVDKKPTSFDPIEMKDAYLKLLDIFINKVKIEHMSSAKILLLTNKAIAAKEGFKQLYQIFDDRYIEVVDHIDVYMDRLEFTDLCNLCYSYSKRQYNSIISTIRKSGYIIRHSSDKIKLKELFNHLVNNNLSALSALNYAFENKILKRNETFSSFIERSQKYLTETEKDKQYQDFKTLFELGKNNYSRMKDDFPFESEDEFADYLKRYKKERFLNALLSNKIKFCEILNYYKYVNESSNYITMHKTKGSSIDSVIVVMDEYFWTSNYDFSLIFRDDPSKQKKKETSQKLIYVACSRARKNLTCICIIMPEQEEDFCRKFPIAEKVDLE